MDEVKNGPNSITTRDVEAAEALPLGVCTWYLYYNLEAGAYASEAALFQPLPHPWFRFVEEMNSNLHIHTVIIGFV